MIEWIFSGIVRLFAWLWTSAMTLYYLAGFFVVVGGLIVFTASVIHHFWKRSLEQRLTTAFPQESRVTVHIENLTLEVTEPQLRRLLAEREQKALPRPLGIEDETSGS